MSEACATCPCPAGCLRWPVFCQWSMAELPDSVQLRHICERSALGENLEYAPLPSPEEAERMIADLERMAREAPKGGRCCG